MADGVMRTLGLALLLLLAGAVRADTAEPDDPTRPPPGFAESGAGAAPGEPALAVTSLFLMGARPYAVVDGQIVHVGDHLGEGRIRRIDAQGVWLRTAAGTKLLRLLPGVEKVEKTGKVEKAEKRPSRRTGKTEK